MAGLTIPEMADRVAGLMHSRLGIPGRDLPEKLRRGGRRLPRRVRAAAQTLAEALPLAGHPRLMRRIDPGQVAAAYQTCLDHLAPIGRAARLRGALASAGASMAFGLLVTGAGFVAFLVWRGYLG